MRRLRGRLLLRSRGNGVAIATFRSYPDVERRGTAVRRRDAAPRRRSKSVARLVSVNGASARWRGASTSCEQRRREIWLRRISPWPRPFYRAILARVRPTGYRYRIRNIARANGGRARALVFERGKRECARPGRLRQRRRAATARPTLPAGRRSGFARGRAATAVAHRRQVGEPDRHREVTDIVRIEFSDANYVRLWADRPYLHKETLSGLDDPPRSAVPPRPPLARSLTSAPCANCARCCTANI